MKSLEAIQKTFRVFKILTLASMLVCFIWALLSLTGVGIWASWKGIIPADGNAVINGVFDFVATERGYYPTLAALLADFVFALTNGILLLLAYFYFKTELKDGTPFTMRGVTAIRTLGIRTIVTPIVGVIINRVIYACYEVSYPENWNNGIYVSLGIVLILASLVFQYGAELEEKVRS